MRRFSLLILGFLISCGTEEGAPEAPTWSQTISVPGKQDVNGIAVDSRGNIWLAGTSDSSFWLAKVSGEDGSLLWDTSWSAGGVGVLRGLALGQSFGVAVGYKREGQYEDGYLVKFSLDGEILGDTVITLGPWAEVLTGIANTNEGFLAVGYTNSLEGGGVHQALVLKISSQGEVESFQTYGELQTAELLQGITPISGDKFLSYGWKLDESFDKDFYGLTLGPQGDSLGAWTWGDDSKDEVALGGCGGALVGFEKSGAQEDGLVLTLDGQGNPSVSLSTGVSGSDTLWAISEGCAVGGASGDMLLWNIEGGEPAIEGDRMTYESLKAVKVLGDGTIILAGVKGEDVFVERRASCY